MVATATLERFPTSVDLLPAVVPVESRPIPVAAYPAGRPRWVTYRGRRQRVVAVHEQPALDPRHASLPYGARRMQVQLANGRLLTLVHHPGGWFERV